MSVKTTIRKDILVLFILCFIVIFLIDFCLHDVEELFEGGAKAGQIIYKICIAYISAFIFYFLVVHLKNVRDKATIEPFLNSKIDIVVAQAKGLTKELFKATGIDSDNELPSNSEIKTICTTLDPNSDAPLLLSAPNNYANWIQYFEYYKERSIKGSNEIYTMLPFLDAELVNILSNIDTCKYFKTIDAILRFNTLRNFESFEPLFLEYFEWIKKLTDYQTTHLK